MKKYIKPNAEYIILLASDVITNSFNFGEGGSGNVSEGGQMPEGCT